MIGDTKEFLQTFEPPIFYAMICLVFVLLVSLFPSIVAFIKKSFTKKQRVFIILSFIVLTFFIIIVPSKSERILYDEDIYINTAQNIAYNGKNQYCATGEFIYGEYICTTTLVNKQPPGYALTLSLPFRIFSVSRETAFYFNNCIFLISIALIFFTIYTITKNWKVALYGTFLYSSVPIVGRWHNTAAAEPVSAMYLSATLLSFLAFTKTNKISVFFLGVVLFALMVFTRYEFVLVAIPIVYLLIRTYFKKVPFDIKQLSQLFWICLLGIVMLVPMLIHFSYVRGDSWGAENVSTFSAGYFENNFNTNIKFFLENKQFPILALALVIGIMISKKRLPLEYFGISFFVTFGTYLFFYAGSYEYGADIRYALNSLSPFIVLCAIGMSVLIEKFGERNIFLVLGVPIAVNMFLLLPSIKIRGQEGWQALWDLEFIRDEIKPRIGENDYVYTNTAYSYHIYGMNGQSTDLLYNPEHINNQLALNPERKYYFHFGYWCSLAPVPGNVAYFCENTALANYDLELVVEKEKRGTRFALYEIKGVKTVTSNP